MKSKVSNCQLCPLIDQPMVLGETNCESDLTQVELLVLAEAPAVEEVKNKRPLIGTAGRIFREAFALSGLDKEKYFISNVVLCSNIIRGKTFNPPKEAWELCKPNWNLFLEKMRPRVVMIMGTVPMIVFGIAESGITKYRGKSYKYKDFDVFLLNHPSYVARNGGLSTEIGQQYLEDMNVLKQKYFNNKKYFLSKQIAVDEEVIADTSLVTPPESLSPLTQLQQRMVAKGDRGGVYAYPYPEWMLRRDDICLIDVQRIRENYEVLFIFKNRNGEKIFTTFSDEDYYCYVYNNPFLSSPMIVDSDKVQLRLLPSDKEKLEADKNKSYGIYESDIPIEIKHSIDYYYRRETDENSVPEADIPLDILYFDIEVFNNHMKSFPSPKRAQWPINSISFKYNDEKTNVWIYLMKNIDKSEISDEIRDKFNVRFFDSEKSLLVSFAEYVRERKPDIITGWNTNYFDFPTLFKRMLRNHVPLNLISPVGRVGFDEEYYHRFFIGGVYCLDMLDLYKSVTQNVEENYKLTTIVRKNLGTDKVAYEGTLDDLYEKNINKFIDYSGTDTDLLHVLSVTLGHIELRNEMRRICSTTWKACETTTGLVDPLIISSVKRMGKVCRNGEGVKKSNQKIEGAYVRQPVGGLYSWVVDFDYTSLYPSIICSMNIGPNTYVAKIENSKDALAYIYKQKKNLPKSIRITFNPLYENKYTKTLSLEEFDHLVQKERLIVTASGCIYLPHDKEESIFFRILRMLLDKRKEYKKLMEVAEIGSQERKKYHNIQWAYKILANSIYGVLLNQGFRFFSTDMGSTITLTGQEAIKFIGYHISRFMTIEKTDIDPYFMEDYDTKNIPYLIYTDTDSIFLNMGDYLMDKKLV